MRYVAELTLICREAEYAPVRAVLRKHGLDASWAMVVKVKCEKDGLPALSYDLQRVGQQVHVYYVPAFDPSEVKHAELLHVYVTALCGRGFSQWAAELSLPPGTMVLDKGAMGKKDIALTDLFEVVISERLRQILVNEALTGWQTEVIRHVDPARDRFQPLYALKATTKLPRLAPETELHYETHENLPEDDPLFGTTGLFQWGPLLYDRRDLGTLADFNHTLELFGEAPLAHHNFVISQRAWKVLRKHRIRNVDVEPVVIRD
jgi:hypothetical protein